MSDPLFNLIVSKGYFGEELKFKCAPPNKDGCRKNCEGLYAEKIGDRAKLCYECFKKGKKRGKKEPVRGCFLCRIGSERLPFCEKCKCPEDSCNFRRNICPRHTERWDMKATCNADGCNDQAVCAFQFKSGELGQDYRHGLCSAHGNASCKATTCSLEGQDSCRTTLKFPCNGEGCTELVHHVCSTDDNLCGKCAGKGVAEGAAPKAVDVGSEHDVQSVVGSQAGGDEDVESVVGSEADVNVKESTPPHTSSGRITRSISRNTPPNPASTQPKSPARKKRRVQKLFDFDDLGKLSSFQQTLEDKSICRMMVPLDQIKLGKNSRTSRDSGVEALLASFLSEGFREQLGSLTVYAMNTDRAAGADLIKSKEGRTIVGKMFNGVNLSDEEKEWKSDNLDKVSFILIDGAHRFTAMMRAREVLAKLSPGRTDLKLPDALPCLVLEHIDEEEYFLLSSACNR
jgi:hypothetical protein